MKLHNIMIYTGYVESGSWSALCYKHYRGFDSAEELMQHFGKCILDSMKAGEKDHHFMKCCLASRKKSHKHCTECGQSTKERTIDVAILSDYILRLHTGDNNSNNEYDTWDNLEGNYWAQWGYSNEDNNFTNVVILLENGEHLLARSAFGRVFEPGPLNEDNYYNGYLLGDSEKERRKSVAGSISIPKKAKLFLDD